MSLIPREQWRIKSSWETYWQNVACSANKSELQVEAPYLPTSPLFGYGYARDAFLDRLYEKRRILFLGNGISREPLDYYFSGFDVTIIDISETACELFTKIMTDVCENVHSFLNETSKINLIDWSSDTEITEDSSQFIYRSGGRIEVICADMFDWNPQVKYHYIHNKLAFLNFTEEDQELLLSHYFRWLEDSGHLQISYYYNKHPNPFKQIAKVAKEIGFLIRDENINEAFKKSKNLRNDPLKYKEFWLEYKRQECEKDAFVVKGDKMLWVMWGSTL